MQTAQNIARWFLEYNRLDRHENMDVEGISNLKLQKLLYYAYGCYLALYNKRLFNDSIVAWQHGPVVASVYHEYKENGANSIRNFEKPEQTFTDDELLVLKWVYKEFGQYTAWALREMTHEEDPWIETLFNNVIPDEVISSYFKEHYVEA